MSTPKFGLLTNPSIDIVKEIRDIYDLGFDYAEIGIEVPLVIITDAEIPFTIFIMWRILIR